ncbi:MAG: glycosyltransferase family 4 protein [Thermodesulfobacteriota bacterium]
MSDFPNNRKVLIAIPVLFVGGTEIYTLNLVKALASGGYHVSICCYYDYESTMLSKLKGEGADVFLLNLKPSDGLFFLLFKLIEIFKKAKPDIVHVQYIAPGLIPIIAARLAGVKRVFATVHQPGRTYGWKAKILIRIAAYLCEAFFCTSKAVEESWFRDSQVFDPEKTISKRKHFTIYNGVDVERIERIGKQVDEEKLKDSLGIKDKKVIGVVGRLRNEKGQATVLESMKRVIQELPDAVLIVIGDGPDRPYLEEMAKEFCLDSHVKWLGQKDHDEVLGLYRIMDVVVVPSVFEGFGLTAAEAMAAGKPVVASNVDGLSEIVQGGVNGLLVPPGDKHALSKAITELLSDPEKTALMGSRGREFIRKNFSLELFRFTILDTYNHFLQV